MCVLLSEQVEDGQKMIRVIRGSDPLIIFFTNFSMYRALPVNDMMKSKVEVAYESGSLFRIWCA